MSEANPYASPTAVSDLAAEGGLDASQLQIATQGKRFLNFIIDTILIQILANLGIAVVVAIYLSVNGPPQTAEAVEKLESLSFALMLLFIAAYFLVMEWAFQRTLAKFLTNTVVVSDDGTKPTFTQILRRTLIRFIPFEPFSFLGGSHPVGWHDRWSGTRVVVGR